MESVKKEIQDYEEGEQVELFDEYGNSLGIGTVHWKDGFEVTKELFDI